MKILTIGFTKKSAEKFFNLIRGGGVKRVIDTRLNRRSQLAGFAKEGDLPFFLREICKVEYRPEPITAPTEEMLYAYKKKQMNWTEYERQYKSLIESRMVEKKLDRGLFDGACILCSEDQPHNCHRRLLAEYLSERWGNVEIRHL
jgi:uncharacterized protein (DUF488 family)